MKDGRVPTTQRYTRYMRLWEHVGLPYGKATQGTMLAHSFSYNRNRSAVTDRQPGADPRTTRSALHLLRLGVSYTERVLFRTQSGQGMLGDMSMLLARHWP